MYRSKTTSATHNINTNHSSLLLGGSADSNMREPLLPVSLCDVNQQESQRQPHQLFATSQMLLSPQSTSAIDQQSNVQQQEQPQQSQEENKQQPTQSNTLANEQRQQSYKEQISAVSGTSQIALDFQYSNVTHRSIVKQVPSASEIEQAEHCQQLFNLVDSDDDDEDDEYHNESAETYRKTNSSMSSDSEYFKSDSKNFDEIYQNLNVHGIHMGHTSRSYAEWSWSQFLEFFFYHLLYFTLGPLCVIIFYPIGKMTLYRNLGFSLTGDHSLIQFTFWSLNTIVTFTYYTNSSFGGGSEFFEIYNMWVLLLFRMFSISCKYAMFHPLTIQLYKQTILTKEEKSKDFYLGKWFNQVEDMQLLEIHGASKRSEIEIALFNMQFFWEVGSETLENLERITILQSTFLNNPRLSLQKQHLQVAAENAKLTFNGTVILQHLIDQFNAKYPIYKNYFLVFIIGFLRSLICLVFRLVKYIDEVAVYTMVQWIMVFLQIVFNTLTYSIIGLFMLALLADLHRIYYLMIQMLFLIKPKKDDHFLDHKKVFPTLNLVLSSNFKNWILLRKLACDYGKRFWMRGQANLSFMVLYSLYPIVCVLLHLLDIFDFCVLELYFLVYDFFIISFSVAICLYLSASINYSYVYHLHILEESRILFRNLLCDDLLKIKHQMCNYLYRTIVKRLKDIAQNSTDVKVIHKQIYKIINAIDDSKSELVLLQQSQPFECFGMSITFTKLKSIMLFMFSIMTFAINFYLKTARSSEPAEPTN